MQHFTRALWIAVAIAATVRTCVRPEQHTVFPVYVAGVTHWWGDQPLYADYAPLDYFRYSPTFAVLLTPLTCLGTTAGGVAWILLNMAVFAAGLSAFRRHVLPGHWTHARSAYFFLVALIVGLPGIWNAQSNAFIIGLVLFGLSALARERWWSAAGLLAASVVLKLTPLPLVLIFVAIYPRQLAGRMLVCVMAGFLLPFLTRPPTVVIEQYRGWHEHLMSMSAERWPGFRDGWTIWAVVRHLLDGGHGLPDLKAPIDTGWYRIIQLLCGLGVLGICLALRARQVQRQTLIALTFALGAGWMILLGPAVEHPTYVFLAPAIGWALVQRDQWPRGRVPIIAASVCLVCLGWGSLARPLWHEAPWLILALPVGVCLFLAWAVGAAVLGTWRVGAVRNDSRPGEDCTASSLKCRFSMVPNKLPKGCRTDATLMPSPTSFAGS